MAKTSVPISYFKARCLALLQRVRETGQPILVTKFGQPVAQIVPPEPERPAHDWLGSLKGTATIAGDLVAPASGPDEWEALKE
jgi:prevent-host-death family protein